ncbi:thioredoxin [Phyllobacterium leguminum]|uniref:Thioredoxin n=1 Tax=Phyllobacterium leguminum TaxID=314237 RepID=A0A318T793_9HYPH|nr:thioredoxin [Phyllobacterium leguminum]PYE88985.1 thioredoxin [Phyllobacterium leguminum]
MSTDISAGSRTDANPSAKGNPDPAMLIKETTTQAFSADVIAESRNQPVLVDFWAPWCGPCKQLTPVLEKAVKEAGGSVKLVKMNIDDHPAIAGQLGIQSIPAVIAFVDGQPVDGFMGAVPESKVKEFISKLGDGGGGKDAAIEEALAAAAELVTHADYDEASQLYSAILEQAPGNVAAIAGLANCLIETGDRERAREVLAQVPDDKKNDAAIRSVETRLTLAEQAAKLGDPKALEAKLAKDQNDHQARFDLAMIRSAEGRHMEAADGLLAIMKSDRGWNDDGARKQLLQFFEAWGPADEATLAARRKLSSLLFS